MQRLVAILLVVALATLPLHTTLAARCGCKSQPTNALLASASPTAATNSESCCSAPQSPEETSDPVRGNDAPCDGSDCPLPCCALVKTLAATTRSLAIAVTAPAATNTHPADTGSPSSPHLSRLQRPPKPVTLA